ncbi:SPFH domain-containing protein [Halobacteriovorax sp. HFRX-2_2]|uniref:flotillin family protein n=1 Tax=unclassified Halobacteriovorax TaxID=2639665 RepID=UPI0037141750
MLFSTFGIMGIIVVPVLILLFAAIFLSKQYKRCPSNQILVIYGSVGSGQSAKCIHGGGSFVIPLLQDYTYLSLEPLTIEIDLRSALSKKNIRVNVPSTFTVGISTTANIMTNAAERLLGLSTAEVSNQAQDIILGQMRLVIATLAIEEINQDREKFLDLVNKNVNLELNKIGLDVINVNIRDITDESGYIEAIGKKAAAEAINKAKVEVAEQDKDGAIGEANANKEKEVQVANQVAESEAGQKEAERNKRIRIAKYEAEGITGEAAALREQEVAQAKQRAITEQGKKEALKEQRVFVAIQEAESVKGENESKESIAEYDATLKEKQADAAKRGEVALAQAQKAVLEAQKLEEIARLEKTELAQEEINKRKVEITAEAEAERQRRIAKGEADAILAKYEAEAQGIQKVLEAKAQGYNKIVEIVGDDKRLVPTLLMVEQLPEIIAQQVKAVQDLKIDKVTVWDGGGNSHNGKSATSNFLSGLINSLPAVHDLAKQAGVELPEFLGQLTPPENKAIDSVPPTSHNQ